jgi:hypothetical protein
MAVAQPAISAPKANTEVAKNSAVVSVFDGSWMQSHG